MDALRLVALLIYTFGAFAYGAILVLWVRRPGSLGWAGRQKASCVSTREVDTLHGALLAVSFLWFVLNIVQLLVGLIAVREVWQLDVAAVVVAFAFSPLIMHMTWAEVATGPSAPLAAGWRLALWPAYVASVALPVTCLALLFGSADARTSRVANHLLGSAVSAAFIITALYCIALVRRQREPGARRHESRRSLVRLFGLMIAVFVLMLIITFLGRGSRPIAAKFVEIAAKSLPLIFMFVSTYYENRFQFFDLFVKRGLALLLTLAALTIWFSVTLPVLAPLATTWAGPWLFAIALVPIVSSIPWLYGRVSLVLDRRWLGRRFSTVEAVTRFLSGLRSATTDAELTHYAEEGLSEIFGAPAAVRLTGAAEDVAFDVVQETTIAGDGAERGRFLMGARASDAPYFGQDVALLASLGDVFASVLDNLRLQERKLEEEQRAREMSLHASRSELKALRAQINPHFLFNALNSIAGLIHRDPAVADRTIEQLADVFRYALRGAESEWAVLDDELDFVRAYLEVERARFGERLHTEVTLEEGARGARIPTMIVQTLVENAVKHGAASVRGHASVIVRARQESGRLVVSVSDNGPGFRDDDPPFDHAQGRPSDGAQGRATRTRGGYGLVNIRQRLEGYFGRDAALTTARDSAGAVTTVSVSLPLVRQEPRMPAAVEQGR